MAKILIVDDEPFNLDVLEQELADRGYAVERAADGAAARRWRPANRSGPI
jgi:CheY-like chemotaxis protein